MDDIGNFGIVSPSVLWTPRHLSEEDIRKGNRSIDSAIVDQYLAIRKRFSSAVPTSDDLRVPANYGGVAFQVFGMSQCPTSRLNDHSLVVVVSYAGLKMVLSGDNEAPSWQELLENQEFVTAIRGTDVLLAPHHGRDAGFCADLFNAMGKPRLVVISDGRFGDTSATDRYGQQVVGWDVFDGSGHVERRKCVTTRCDGHITIKFGWNDFGTPQQRAFLEVRTSKPDIWSTLLRGSLGGHGTVPR